MIRTKNRLRIIILSFFVLVSLSDCSIIPDQYQTLSSYQITYLANFPIAAPAIDCTGSMAVQTVTEGLEVNLSTNGFACVGYHLIGWTTQGASGGVELAPGGTVSIGDSDLTLYGVWATNEQVTLRYDNNYQAGFDWGPTTMSPVVMYMNSYTTMVANVFTLESHKYLGWSTNSAATTPDYLDGDVFTIGLVDVTLYAVWELNPQYPLYFNANDGIAVSAETSQDFHESETKTIDANTFVYYGVSPEGIINTAVTGGRTFKGWRWTAVGLPSDIDLLDSDTYTYPAPGVVDSGDIPGTAPKLYAVWEENAIHTITYKIDDGYGVSSITQDFFEGEIKGLLPFVSTGFIPNLSAPQNFSGWATSSSNNAANVVYSDEQNYTMGSGDITLYAVWTNNTYRTVTYNSNGGDGVMSNQELPDGVNATLISNTFSLSGYNFTGWSETPAPAYGAVADYLDASAINISADLELYAIWTVNPPVQITYTNNSPDGGSTTVAGVMVNQEIAQGSTANLSMNTFTRTGYTFAGWSRSTPVVNELSTISLSDGQSYFMETASVDFSLYAVWQSNSYNVTFDDNISATPPVMNFPPDQTVYFDSQVSSPPQPSRAGYDFWGWYKEAALTTLWNFGADTINLGSVPSGTELTLYASWTPKNYTITYDSQGGTSVAADSGDFGTTVTAPTPPTKAGYIFDNWYTDYPAFSDIYNFGSDTIEGDQTLYANWTPVSHIITYDGNTSDGGTVPSNSGNSYDYDVSVLCAGNTFSKTGFNFTGWNTAVDGSGVTYSPNINFQMKFTADTTLYAQWDENTNRLIYDGNGATAGTLPVESGIYHDYNSTVLVAVNTFIKDGYIFSGWNRVADGSGTMYRETGEAATLTDIIMDNPNSDITLYAQWVKGPEITITLPVSADDGYINSSEKTDNVIINITDADQVRYKLGSTPLNTGDGTALVNGVNTIAVDTLTGIAEGNVQIYVRAWKDVGSLPLTVDISNSSTLFIFDLTAPIISGLTMLGDNGDGYINNSEKGSLVFIQTTGDPVMVRVKTGGYPAGTSDGTRVNEFSGVVPINGVSGISEGAARQIYARVWDAAGNFTSLSSASFNYDITAPSPPTISFPASAADGWINEAERLDDITIGLSSADVAVVRAQFGGVPTTQTSGTGILLAGDVVDISAMSGISEGLGRQVSLRVWDLAGNYTDTTSADAFNYDITLPGIPTITLPTELNDGYSNIADATNDVIITGSTGSTTLRYKWDGYPAATSDGYDIATPTTGVTSLLNTFTGLTSGASRVLYVRAWDDAGNYSSNYSATFGCDLDLPIISISLPTAFDAGVGTPYATSGDTGIIVGSTDRWINASEKDSLVTFTSSDITAGVGGLIVRCSASGMPASITDGIDVDAGTGSIPVSSIPGIVEGRTNRIYFRVWDSAGNDESGNTAVFGYDITAPVAAVITDFSRVGSLLRDREVTYPNATDNLSDFTLSQIAYMVSSANGFKPDFGNITYVNYWGNHPNASQITNCPFSPDYGTKYVRVWAVDEAGNIYYYGYESK